MANEKRLIDANELWEKTDALEKATAEEWGWQEMCDGISQVKDLICEAATVDAVEVVHGRWEWKPINDHMWILTCSACGSQEGAFDSYKYCPNCGAKMDGDGNG